MMRKHLVESVVPLLVELRAQLSAARSPLLGPLAATTAALLKDYKAEVEDILVADKQASSTVKSEKFGRGNACRVYVGSGG